MIHLQNREIKCQQIYMDLQYIGKFICHYSITCKKIDERKTFHSMLYKVQHYINRTVL